MAQPTFHYDEPGDTLFISFQPGKKAMGVELNEHILLRIDRNAGTELSAERRKLVLRLLRRPPASDVHSTRT